MTDAPGAGSITIGLARRRWLEQARWAVPVLLIVAATLLVLRAPGGPHLAVPSATPDTPLTPGRLYGEATWAAGAAPAPAIGLRDQAGQRFSWSLLHGRPAALAFLDSHCTAACPLEGRALARSESALPAGERPVLVVVSVNPLDTPASARAAVARWGLAAEGRWHWLMGTRAQLERVWRAYHIAVRPSRGGDVGHTEALLLIGHRSDERSGYLYPFATRFVTHDLRTLSAERFS